MMNRGGIIREERGVALMVVLATFSAMTIFLSTFLSGVNRQLDSHRLEEHRIFAGAIADAGIEKAISSILINPSGYTGEEAMPIGRGHFSAEVTMEAGSARIVSTGVVEEGGRIFAEVTRRVDVRIEKGRVISILPVPKDKSPT